MVAAAALLASVTAFAQNEPASPSSSDQASAPAAASADDSAKADKPMHKHHHRSGTAARGGKGTDWNADKLNSCMSNSTPTAQQEECLKSAAGTGNG
jgi:hypothetical protein